MTILLIGFTFNFSYRANLPFNGISIIYNNIIKVPFKRGCQQSSGNK